jgi:hypothetical protein
VPVQILAMQVQCMSLLHVNETLDSLPQRYITQVFVRTVYDKGSWTQLSPDGEDVSKHGWLEHHVREMCNALRPEVSRCKGSFCAVTMPT